MLFTLLVLMKHRVMIPVMPEAPATISDVSSGKFRVLTSMADVWGVFMATTGGAGFNAVPRGTSCAHLQLLI